MHRLSGEPGAGAVVTVNVAARSVRDADEHQNARAPGRSTVAPNAPRISRDFNYRSFLAPRLTPHLNKTIHCSAPELQDARSDCGADHC